MNTYQNPSHEQIQDVIRGSRPIPTSHWRWGDQVKDEDLRETLQRGIAIKYSSDNGEIDVWQYGGHYFGIVHQWGSITVLVAGDDVEKLTTWLFWKRKVLRA